MGFGCFKIIQQQGDYIDSGAAYKLCGPGLYTEQEDAA